MCPTALESASRLLIAMALVVSATLAACGSPCQSLADKICECKPSTAEINGCKEQVRSARALRDATKAEQDYCSMVSDQCTCEAIDRNDLAKCGIGKPAPKLAP